MNKKVVLTVIMEGDEEILKDLKGQVMETVGRYMLSATATDLEEPKKEIDTSFFGICNHRKGV